MMTSMTPARSPNMNSGWPDEISSSSDLPCHGIGARRGGDDLEIAVGDGQREAAAHAAVIDGALAGCRGLPRAVPALSSASSITALTSSPADSASIALALRSISSCQLTSERKRTAATTTRKMTISVGIERLSSGSAASRRR